MERLLVLTMTKVAMLECDVAGIEPSEAIANLERQGELPADTGGDIRLVMTVGVMKGLIDRVVDNITMVAAR